MSERFSRPSCQHRTGLSAQCCQLCSPRHLATPPTLPTWCTYLFVFALLIYYQLVLHLYNQHPTHYSLSSPRIYCYYLSFILFILTHDITIYDRFRDLRLSFLNLFHQILSNWRRIHALQVNTQTISPIIADPSDIYSIQMTHIVLKQQQADIPRRIKWTGILKTFPIKTSLTFTENPKEICQK